MTEQTTLKDYVKGATLVDIESLKLFPIEELLKTDCDGETPLHYAASNGDIEICKILISRCPELNTIKDNENTTAYGLAMLMYMKEYRFKEVCEYLYHDLYYYRKLFYN